MAYQFQPGDMVPESGIYRITHDAQHVAAEREVTVLKGRRFPICRHCRSTGFELTHAAKHVSEIPHLHEEGVTATV